MKVPIEWLSFVLNKIDRGISTTEYYNRRAGNKISVKDVLTPKTSP